jgi:hypothetical protein
VVSASDIWAVGWSRTFGPVKALVEHWNGVNWTQVPTPAPEPPGEFVEQRFGTGFRIERRVSHQRCCRLQR